ncbi:sensor domain-containing diguanylate cyclase [Cetobacterium somerae]|uniref:sensor domain-containing diguanylate cyclase n=1 Tax=Cetobacterium sp. NK01 TaxID=2993530 RepID=UPI00211728E0|nr:sensor domain-containing diguanylate cyclase [Cetobacterium sp. NK01]MCQ8212788.1 sensor domain-containing diguanylate cyclase [Cetobacterium sp. NK01]
MFENILLDNLTVGILVLDSNFKINYLNKLMKKILIDQNIMLNNSEISLEKLYSINGYKIKSYSIENNTEKFLQLEFHEINKNSENKLVAMLDTVQDFIFYLDSEGRIEYFNKAYADFIGRSYEDIIGRKESEFFSKEMACKCEENNKKALKYGNFYEEENFQDNWYHTFKSRVDLENNEFGILGMIKEITESKKKDLDLKEKVYKDILTGIYNRNFYEEKIKRIFEVNKNTKFSIMLMDIDKFKEINDTQGHDIGDLVLKNFSKLLKRNVRKDNDFIIRIGGDELAIIVEGSLKDLRKIYERVESDISNEKLLNDLKFSISVGFAERDQCESLKSLYKKADIELYKMKNRRY